MAGAKVSSSNTARDRMAGVDLIARKILTEVGGKFAQGVTSSLISKGKSDPSKQPIVVTPAFQTQTGWAVKIGPRFDHLFFVHTGRRPGAKMPPIDPIYDWMVRKGLSSPSRGSAFVIARAIGRDGIPPFPYLTEAYKMSRQSMMEEIKRRLREELSKL